MTALNPHQVRRAIERLKLSPKDRKAIELILPLLGNHNQVTIKAVHETLYRFADTATANNSLKNLCNRFNQAATTQGLNITVQRSPGKKGGSAARQLWFEGPIPPPDAALARELDHVRRCTVITDPHAVVGDLGENTPTVDVMSFLTDWATTAGTSPLCLLLGENGTGKTVTCQRLSEYLHQAHATDPSIPAPIYLDLREVWNFHSGIPTLAATVQECFNRGWRADRSYSLDDFWSWVDQGAVVIFDSLDDVLCRLKDQEAITFTRGLLDLLEITQRRHNEDPSHNIPKVLVSCRPQYFRTLNEQRNHIGHGQADAVTTLHLLPFTREQSHRYLEGLAGRNDTPQGLELLDEVYDLADLASRPLMVRMLGEQLENLDSQRRAGHAIRGVDIYEDLVQRWLDRDDGQHHFKPPHKLKLMEHLAAHLWRNETTGLEASELEQWLHKWRNTQQSFTRYNHISPDLLEKDLRVATLLTRHDKGNTFGFAHTSLQEYFLARYLLHAVRDDQPENWAIRCPTNETLEFLGQLFDTDPNLIHTLNSWHTHCHPQTAELILHYGRHAQHTNHPVPYNTP
ncbi:MAG: hypothetical protein Q4D96_09315 [Propionibacteriaceae bacterium]|nr:hypothetical protein [Propionibacteriaceae bacterium]